MESLNYLDELEIGPISSQYDAVEIIHSLYEQGKRPIVSVPIEFREYISKGLEAYSTWIPGFSAIVGTIGREPYLPPGEDRLLIKVDLPPTSIRPRFTGPDNSFHGVVFIDGPVPPNSLEIIR